MSNPPPPLCLLVTGGGAPGVAGTLYALRHNPQHRAVRIVLVDANARAVGQVWADSFHTVPHGSAPEYATRLAEVCATERVDVILPQTTAEVARLSADRAFFSACRVAIAAADGPAVAAANDKHELLQRFAALGLPHPRFVLCRSTAELEDAARQFGYPDHPFIVKPPVSNGMRGFRKLSEERLTLDAFLQQKPAGDTMRLAELLAVLRPAEKFPALLATEFLPGDEYTVDAFVGRGGRVAIPRLRRSIRSGISFDNTIEDRPDVAGHTLTAAAALGLTGAFGFQFKLDAAGVPKVLECNPRVQGTMAASVFAGVNIIWLGIREALGESFTVEAPPFRPAEFVRYWGGVGRNADGVFVI